MDAVERAWPRRRAARSTAVQPKTSAASGIERLTVIVLVLLGLAEVVAAGWYLVTRFASVPSGSLSVTSKPAGALFLIDGEVQGVTPATVRVPAGAHALEIRSVGPTQIMALNVEKGGQISRFFDLPAGTAAARLRVETSPPGARVMVDGRARGRSPIVIANLNPGPHVLRVERSPQSVERAVMLEPGATASLTLTLEPLSYRPTEGTGWLAVSVPVEVHAYENGRLVGTSRAGPWQLGAGRHDLEFVNEMLGLHVRRTVDLTAGRTLSLDVTVPSELVSITTSPPAKIHIDGESVGMAPILNHQLAVGQHDVVAQHPELGERRLSVTVAAGASLSVNLVMR